MFYQAKCTQYWPTGSKEYGSITVTLHKEEVFADYIVRTLVVKKVGPQYRTSEEKLYEALAVVISVGDICLSGITFYSNISKVVKWKHSSP